MASTADTDASRVIVLQVRGECRSPEVRLPSVNPSTSTGNLFACRLRRSAARAAAAFVGGFSAHSVLPADLLVRRPATEHDLGHLRPVVFRVSGVGSRVDPRPQESLVRSPRAHPARELIPPCLGVASRRRSDHEASGPLRILIVGRNSAGSKPRHVDELVYRVPFHVWMCFSSNAAALVGFHAHRRNRPSVAYRAQGFTHQRPLRRCSPCVDPQPVWAAVTGATERSQLR